MGIVLFIGLIFVAVSFGLFARVLLLPQRRRTETLQQIEGYGFGTPVAPAAQSGRRLPKLDLGALLDGTAAALGAVVTGRFGQTKEDDLRRLLRGAGFYTLPVRRFVGYQVLGTLTLFSIFLLLALTGKNSALFSITLLVIGTLAGWTLPLMYVRRRARERADQIDYAMPDLIDTLVATVEAGIAFSASLQIAAKRFRGALGDELRLTLQEQNMGLAFDDSLHNMLQRQNTRSIRAFVRALIQGEELGVAVGQTLRNLSHEMRLLRRQLAEERAQKAPVKLVFPIVLLILPALLLTTLGPAIIRIHQIFH